MAAPSRPVISGKSMTPSRPGDKIAILANHVAGETYGLPGPRLAATIIGEQTGRECPVASAGLVAGIRFPRLGSVIAWWVRLPSS